VAIPKKPLFPDAAIIFIVKRREGRDHLMFDKAGPVWLSWSWSGRGQISIEMLAVGGQFSGPIKKLTGCFTEMFNKKMFCDWIICEHSIPRTV